MSASTSLDTDLPDLPAGAAGFLSLFQQQKQAQTLTLLRASLEQVGQHTSSLGERTQTLQGELSHFRTETQLALKNLSDAVAKGNTSPKAPTQASRLALRLNAWLAQIHVNLLDAHDLSPVGLDKHLAAFRTLADDRKKLFQPLLKKLTVRLEGESPMTGEDIVSQCLLHPLLDPKFKDGLSSGKDVQRHAAFDTLCNERAFLLTLLMAEVATRVTGDDTGLDAEHRTTFDNKPEHWTLSSPAKKTQN